jgi:hypothetical protein
MDRRGFLGAILAAGIAPAFVRIGSLMRPAMPADGGLIFHPDSISLEVPAIELAYGNRLLTPEVVAREALVILESKLWLYGPLQSMSSVVNDPSMYQAETIALRKAHKFIYGL